MYALPLNIAQAALGTEVEIPTLDGKESLKIPAGTQHGKTFRIKNKGVPNLKRSGRGDLIVTTNVTVPSHLSERQKAILREFARTLDESPPNGDRNLLDQLKDALMGG
jgi:molecular chaperone DnaJ